MYIQLLRTRTREVSTLHLPDFPLMTAETLEAIRERHGLRAGEISPSKNAGIFNAIYLVGNEHVLRVPREAPPFVAAIRKESIAVPAARAAGVRTPTLVAFDDSWSTFLCPTRSTNGCLERRSVCSTSVPKIHPGCGRKWD